MIGQPKKSSLNGMCVAPVIYERSFETSVCRGVSDLNLILKNQTEKLIKNVPNCFTRNPNFKLV